MAPILRGSRSIDLGGKSSVNDEGTWLIGKFPIAESVIYALVHSSTLQWNDPKDDREVIAGRIITTTLDQILVEGTVFVFSTIKMYLDEVLEKYERDGEIVSRDNMIFTKYVVALKSGEKEELQDVHSEREPSKSDNGINKKKTKFKNKADKGNDKRKRSLNKPSTSKNSINSSSLNDNFSGTETDSDGGSNGSISSTSQPILTCCCTNKKNCTSQRGDVDDVRKEVEMIPIGTGQTLIPKHVYDTIDWRDYRLATRNLLMILFSRRELATHNMSGKSSHAYKYKPTKLRLNKVKVRDIILAVTKICKATTGDVRFVITNKCCSEKTMYRRRTLRKEKLKKMKEKEKLKGNENGNVDRVEEGSSSVSSNEPSSDSQDE